MKITFNRETGIWNNFQLLRNIDIDGNDVDDAGYRWILINSDNADETFHHSISDAKTHILEVKK